VCGIAFRGIYSKYNAARMLNMPITEEELRAHMRAELAARVSIGITLIEELQLERGRARVDLALVGKELEAFELKSDFDNFARMHNQIHAYNRVFDKITLVTGGAHALAATAVVPSWWGIVRIERSADGSLRSHVVRAATSHDRQEPLSLAMLLWRDEAAEVLDTKVGHHSPKRATRPQLQIQLAQTLDFSTLREVVAAALAQRDVSLKVRQRPSQDDDSLHRAANCLDFHFQL